MHEFGRTIQLGRIKGNFLFILECMDVQTQDKSVFPMFIEEHAKLFGKDTLKSIATDKGYFSRKNRKLAIDVNIGEIGIQTPANIKVKPKVVQAKISILFRASDYLARARDPPPGPLVIWRGLMKLNDFQRLARSNFESS